MGRGFAGLVARTCAAVSPALEKGAVAAKVSASAATSPPKASTMPRTRSRNDSFASSSEPPASSIVP